MKWDFNISLKFYEDVLGMERIPTYNFGFTTQYLRCGDLQIHVFLLEDKIPFYQHFAIDVDDFHAVYEAGKKLGALDNSAFKNANCAGSTSHSKTEFCTRMP